MAERQDSYLIFNTLNYIEKFNQNQYLPTFIPTIEYEARRYVLKQTMPFSVLNRSTLA